MQSSIRDMLRVNTTQINQMVFTAMKFNIILIISVVKIIFALSFTFPIQAKNQKLMLNNILNTKNNAEYCSNIHEYINFSPKSVVTISFQNTMNNPDMLIANTEKYL
ncbi:MAG: hypothetical protein NTX91_03465 [candidate division SR1 bacterium]|nr:hypothetical protein [candidate division SR1 bacterium]